ncbi:MAG: AMP-binding protein [Burkholderiaceae bacterium]
MSADLASSYPAALQATIHRARQQNISDVLRRTAQRMGDKPAIVFDGVSWTYAETDAICNRVAHSLVARGVQPGDRVAILSRNSSSFVALRFALARIGAILVPINFMLNASEIAFILRSSGAQLLAVGS